MTKASKSLQTYGSWSVAKDAKVVEESASRGDLPPIVKLAEGKTHLRFLPPAAGKDSPFVTIHQHFIRNDETDEMVVFNCPKRMLKKKCPACEVADQLFRSGRRADKDRAKKYWPKKRIWANVFEVENEEDGVKAFPFGTQIYESLVALGSDAGDFTHPEEGFNIIITRKGSGLKTKYTVHAARGDAPLENDEWVEELHDLEACFGRVPDFDEAEEKLSSVDGTNDDDDEGSADDDIHADDAEIVD